MALERRGPAGWTIHPGEVLREEFMKPMRISGYALAKVLAVKPQTISKIVREKRGISADMALRLGKFFGVAEQFWMNLQTAYDLGRARKANAASVRRIAPYKPEAA
jgi:addiction module HigA family antidote